LRRCYGFGLAEAQAAREAAWIPDLDRRQPDQKERLVDFAGSVNRTDKRRTHLADARFM